MPKTYLINGSTDNQDTHLSKLISSIATSGIIEGLEVTGSTLSAGYAFIKCTRSGDDLYALFVLPTAISVNTTGTRKIYATIPQSFINSPETIVDNNVGSIGTGTSRPTDPHVKIAEVNSGVLSFVNREEVILTKKRKISGEGLSIVTLNVNGEEVFIDAGTNGQVLHTDGLSFYFESPSVNITGLPSTTNASGNILVEQSGTNRSLNIQEVERKIVTNETAGNTISAGNLVGYYPTVFQTSAYSTSGGGTYNVGRSTSDYAVGMRIQTYNTVSSFTLEFTADRVGSSVGTFPFVVRVYNSSSTLLGTSSTFFISPGDSFTGSRTISGLSTLPGIHYITIEPETSASTSFSDYIRVDYTDSLANEYQLNLIQPDFADMSSLGSVAIRNEAVIGSITLEYTTNRVKRIDYENNTTSKNFSTSAIAGIATNGASAGNTVGVCRFGETDMPASVAQQTIYQSTNTPGLLSVSNTGGDRIGRGKGSSMVVHIKENI